MPRKRVKGTKYNRVTKQQKYVFLKLCISQKLSIHEAAYNAGIHYSTAKTILFFHKKQYKNYETYFINDGQMNEIDNSQPRALYRQIICDSSSSDSPIPRIEVISKFYSKNSSLKGLWKQRKTLSDSLKQEEGSQCVKMEDQSFDKQEWYQQMEQKVKSQEINMKLQLLQWNEKMESRTQKYQYKKDEKK